jgi:Uma2 family endonuclease
LPRDAFRAMAQKIDCKHSVAAAAPPAKMTYAEFLAWADEDVNAEWVEGEVVLLSPASDRHQNLADFLTALLRLFAEAREAGVIRSAPFQMKTGRDLPGREPDIVYVANAHLNRLKGTHLDGPADIAVEIISPESRARDRGAKFVEYQKGGVQEYWLLDPLRKQAEFYRLTENGNYGLVTVAEEGVFHSSVLEGLWLKVEWLWQEPLPHLLAVLKEWGLL